MKLSLVARKAFAAILDHVGRGVVRDDDRCVEAGVEAFDDGGRCRASPIWSADHDARWRHEVGNGRPFSQELRIGRHRSQIGTSEPCGERGRGPERKRAPNDNRRSLAMVGNGCARAAQLGQVCLAVHVEGRPNAHEDRVATGECGRRFVGDVDPPGRDSRFELLLEARLVEWNDSRAQRGHPLRADLEQRRAMSEPGKAGRGDHADVTGAHDSDVEAAHGVSHWRRSGDRRSTHQ